MSRRSVPPSTYERLLDRAWKACYDASEVAENELRWMHHKKLLRAAAVIVEIQSDVRVSTNLSAGRQMAFEEAVRDIHGHRGGEHIGPC